MPHERRRFGDAGEDLAVRFFRARGFAILARNWTCRLGEIDLIVEKDGVTHFVEVKTRRSLEFGYPEEAITGLKLRHLARAVEIYLLQSRNPPRDYEADALAITILPNADPEYFYVERIL